MAEPFLVKFPYRAEEENEPIKLNSHNGKEFDVIVRGYLKVQVGNYIDILNKGDSIFYNIPIPHGMIAVSEGGCEFHSEDILPMFAKYHITTFCAQPTMCRFFIKEDLSKYDLYSIKYATTVGEALNPEVSNQFKKETGLTIMEGFGQTETTLSVANFVNSTPKLGSMGKPSSLYDVVILDPDGNECKTGDQATMDEDGYL